MCHMCVTLTSGPTRLITHTPSPVDLLESNAQSPLQIGAHLMLHLVDLLESDVQVNCHSR